MKRWHWHAVKWVGWSSLGLAALVTAVTGAFLLWLAVSYSRAYPLNLTPYLPRIEAFLAGQGVDISVGKLELFFDDAPVLRASDVALKGTGGEMAVFVEQAAIKLANRRVMMLQVSPKVIEAKGVTLRLVRKGEGFAMAGFAPMERREGGKDFVSWLNGLRMSGVWSRLKDVRMDKLNLLLRDEVQDAEWVMENGRLAFTRYSNDGERATMVASIRRLYGSTQSAAEEFLAGRVTPVLVSFDHAGGAREAFLSAKFDRTDVGIVADYFPPQLKDLLKARGSVEVGTVLLPDNALGRPWVTLRLARVEILPPSGFSKPLEFPRLTLTASYRPSPTDVLEIRDLALVGIRGGVWRAKGKVSDVTTDPLVDVQVSSEEGDVQGIFDFFPDQPRGFRKALAFVRPNISDAGYRNLTATFRGRPSAFPHCEDACGVVEIDADITGGKVKFLPEFSPAVTQSAKFTWRGQTFSVFAPEGTLADQTLGDVAVTLTGLFSPSPTYVNVSGTMAGDLGGVVNELRGLDDKKRLPREAGGQHVSKVGVVVVLPRGREATFRESTVLVDSRLTDMRVGGLEELGEAVFEAPTGKLSVDAAKNLRIEAKGRLNGAPLEMVWQQGIDPDVPHEMRLSMRGGVDGAWLAQRAGNPEGVSLTGVVEVAANIIRTVSDTWRFGVRADAGRAEVAVGPLSFTKPRGESLKVEAQGIRDARGMLRLDSLKMDGRNVDVNGKLAWNPRAPDDTMAVFKPFRLGRTDVEVNYANRAMSVRGKGIDLSGIDLFGDGDGQDMVKNVRVEAQLEALHMRKGSLKNVSARLRAVDGVWDIQEFLSAMEGGAQVNIRTEEQRGGRRRLNINVEDVGAALTTLGIYEAVKGGKLWGDIVYESATRGAGTLKMENFELDHPPVLMRLLSLLSLEQIFTGTDKIIFNKAQIPLRIDGKLVHLDNAGFEGPGMTIRLDGTYTRGSESLDFDGKLAPAIPFNRLVSKVPLIGTLLTGSQDGVVVADFTLKGTPEDVQISVKPLSVLTPGLLKDFWRGLTGGGR